MNIALGVAAVIGTSHQCHSFTVNVCFWPIFVVDDNAAVSRLSEPEQTLSLASPSQNSGATVVADSHIMRRLY